MSKRTTRADLILSEARARLGVAEQEERNAVAELRLASAVVAVHRANLHAAEKLLTPKPRQKAEKPAAGVPAQKGLPGKEARCGVCYEIEDHPNHDSTYLSAHKFDPPKSVARVARKSKQKSERTNSIPSSGTSSEDDGVAVLAAGGGD